MFHLESPETRQHRINAATNSLRQKNTPRKYTGVFRNQVTDLSELCKIMVAQWKIIYLGPKSIHFPSPVDLATQNIVLFYSE